MCEFLTNGQVKFILLDPHWITGPYLKKGSTQEELELNRDANLSLHIKEKKPTMLASFKSDMEKSAQCNLMIRSETRAKLGKANVKPPRNL